MHVAYACVYGFLAVFFKRMYLPAEAEDSLGSSTEGTFVSRGSLACVELNPGHCNALGGFKRAIDC